MFAPFPSGHWNLEIDHDSVCGLQTWFLGHNHLRESLLEHWISFQPVVLLFVVQSAEEEPSVCGRTA